MLSVLVLLAPLAIVLSFVYLWELRTFLAGLRRESAGLWAELGAPVLGAATLSVALPLLRGRFPGFEGLSAGQRRRAGRLRGYLVGLTLFYLVFLVAMLFRRELGLTI